MIRGQKPQPPFHPVSAEPFTFTQEPGGGAMMLNEVWVTPACTVLGVITSIDTICVEVATDDAEEGDGARASVFCLAVSRGVEGRKLSEEARGLNRLERWPLPLISVYPTDNRSALFCFQRYHTYPPIPASVSAATPALTHTTMVSVVSCDTGASVASPS